MYRYHQNSKSNFGIALKSRYLGMAWFLLHNRHQSRSQLEVDLEPVVADPEAMEFVRIQLFAVHNGDTVELDLRIVVPLLSPAEPVVADLEGMDFVKIKVCAARNGAIVELDLPIVVRLDKLLQLPYRIHP